MSWGYFIDFHLTLPTKAWERLSSTEAGAFPTALGWWGFRDAELERRFIDTSGNVANGLTFSALVARFAREESLGRVSRSDDVVTLRVASLLDRGGDTDIARGFAALLEAARESGGVGSVSLINDGTYGGEDGVTIDLSGGELVRKHIADCWELTERLSAELFGDLEEEDELDDEGVEDEAPARRAPAKKAAAKKAAAKNAPAKKAPAKKAPAKKASRKPGRR